MKNNLKIIILVLILVAALGVAGYFVLGSKKRVTINIERDAEVTEEIEVENTQETENIQEEIVEEKAETEKPAEKNPPAGGEASEKNENTFDLKIIPKYVSWGFQEASGRKIDAIIIHSTYNALGGDRFNLAKILDIYKSYGVAPHYIIDRGGAVYQLVVDKNIAYHAGESQVPDGRTNVNAFSIGIEMINDKDSQFTKEQYASLNALLASLKSRYSIKYILGHDQIAPGRKDDPWNLDWKRIAQ